MNITLDTLQNVFRNPAYSKRTHRHLFQVYRILASMLLSAVIGVIYCIRVNPINGLGSLLLLLGSITGVSIAPQKYRSPLVCLCAFFIGSQVSSYIGTMQGLDNAETLIASAFISTCAMFTCFSAAAFFATRSSYLYLCGILSTALLLMPILYVASAFFHSSLLDNALLYIGTMIFSGYVVVDTQLILERAESGDLDVSGHALHLFLDLFSLFIRILRLVRRSEEKKQKG